MQKANVDIRYEAKNAKLPLWVIADKIGIGEITLIRRLRKELPTDEKAKIRAIIAELKAGE